MDPLAAWVDLEPLLTATGLGLAMATAASQGTTQVEDDTTTGCEMSPSCRKERSSMLLGRRCGFTGDEGPCRGVARWRRIHPSMVTRVNEGARGSAVAFSDSLALGSHCGAEERGGSGENECARVWQREPSAGFVRAENLRDRRI
jgi:hypothetical protein